MDVQEMLGSARDALTVRRVYGEPVERDGVTLIPAASVFGGGGGGSGEQADGQTGDGGGFGLRARPVGAFVIRGDSVSWEPAFDLNRAVLGGQAIALIGFLILILRRRSRGGRRRACASRARRARG